MHPARLALACCVLLPLLPPPAAAMDGGPWQVVRIQATDPGLRQQLGDLFGHIAFDEAGGMARVDTDAGARAQLRRLGIGWEVDLEASRALNAFVAGGVHGLRSIPGYACYRTVEETFASIDAMVAQYPTLASLVDIGVSWRRMQDPGEGWPLRVLRLGSPARGGSRPVLFAMASIHAREFTPAELVTRFAESLLAGYGTDPEATWLLDHHEFHLLLHANPDGRKRAEELVLWRKNENLTHCPQHNANPISSVHPGVDLNRNYPFNWAPGAAGSTAQCNATFPGSRAASEPETIAVRDYLLSIYPDTRPGTGLTEPADPDTAGLFLDMHSYSGLVLWPWGVNTPSGNEQAFRHLGRRLAWFNNYTPQPSWALYETRGTTIDFAYGELGVPAITFELGTAFFENCTNFENTILPHNLAALRYAARTLHAPFRLPAGPDSHEVTAGRPAVHQGDRVIISAVIDDSRYRNSGGVGGPLPVHTVAGATLYIGRLPWQPGAAGLPMQATDGAFDSSVESVLVQLETRHMAPGRHLLYVQGTDVNGDAGPPAAVFLDVLPDPDRIFMDGWEVDIGPWSS